MFFLKKLSPGAYEDLSSILTTDSDGFQQTWSTSAASPYQSRWDCVRRRVEGVVKAPGPKAYRSRSQFLQDAPAQSPGDSQHVVDGRSLALWTPLTFFQSMGPQAAKSIVGSYK